VRVPTEIRVNGKVVKRWYEERDVTPVFTAAIAELVIDTLQEQGGHHWGNVETREGACSSHKGQMY